jgi:Ser/Thr protein kinase RdoA (MazF antagonist)
VRGYGSGNVNATFLVTVGAPGEGRFILQRLNSSVFKNPAAVIANLRVVANHVQHRLQLERPAAGRRWEVPVPIAAQDGRYFFVDQFGEYWRAMTFLANGEAPETVRGEHHAQEAGYALGRMHALLGDLDPASLVVTLPGFHQTPLYLERYQEIAAGMAIQENPAEVRSCRRFIVERQAMVGVLEEARRDGRLVVRPIHGDPKISNILLDRDTGRAMAMVDLDTVGPGLIHYDLGDCLRSCCNPAGEEAKALGEVRFDLDLCRAILAGYALAAANSLTADDREFLYDAVRLLAFELGLRFFTDYLEGDRYFNVRYPGQNLQRAMVQFQLTADIEAREHVIRALANRRF